MYENARQSAAGKTAQAVAPDVPRAGMNFVVICLHCLDMRDFHSQLRRTPILDDLRRNSVFIPMGRAQGHNQADSLNAELTGVWTARCCNSRLTTRGYEAPDRCWLPPTLLERLASVGYDVLTCIDFDPRNKLGSFAVTGGMAQYWLKDAPERMAQFSSPHRMGRAEWLDRIKASRRFYAHIVLRETHRPWAQERELYGLLGRRYRAWRSYRRKRHLPTWWPYDAYVARRAALERGDAFAALRQNALAVTDGIVAEIFDATQHLDDVTYVVYSNHGEVFDHFRYTQRYGHTTQQGLELIEGTSHGPYPYEVLYANMQMWMAPGLPPRVMRGTGRSIDFAPTVLELAGEPRDGMDGESMLPCFATGVFPARDRYAESPAGGGCISMVTADGSKLLAVGAPAGSRFAGHELAVFDLETDPYEYVNLIDTSQGQEVLAWAVARHEELARSRHPPEGTPRAAQSTTRL
jgi:hypothetical protein